MAKQNKVWKKVVDEFNKQEEKKRIKKYVGLGITAVVLIGAAVIYKRQCG